jgi:hypothetical protein
MQFVAAPLSTANDRRDNARIPSVSTLLFVGFVDGGLAEQRQDRVARCRIRCRFHRWLIRRWLDRI